MTIEDRLSALEGRVRALEGVIYKRGGVGAAVKRLVEQWPGPFTFQQIHEAVIKQKGLEDVLLPPVQQRLYKMEQGFIIRTHQGTGCVSNIFERCHRPNDPSSNRTNRKTDYESGFRHIIRSALASEDLPEVFGLEDIQKWMAIHMPAVQVPYGSWSSTLYKLQERGELIVVAQKHTTKLKRYRRGEKVIQASGEEMAELEKAWSDFRKTLDNGQPAESWSDGGLSVLQRGEL